MGITRMIKKFISKYYNEKLEDICTRVLYFFNTIDTYFLIAGAASFLWFRPENYKFSVFLLITAAVLFVFKTADFYPLFLLFSPIYLFFLFRSPFISVSLAVFILLANLAIFALIQFIFMSIPESIVARNLTIGIRKIWNSAFTLAPTTVSLPMSVFFSTLYSLILVARPNPSNSVGFLFWITIGGAALITHIFKPKTFVSSDFKPKITGKLCKKVILLNIDGCRLDRFYEAKLPFLTFLEKESTYFPHGLQTVYRALTNPAFASIFTGAVPGIHGIKSNNLGQAMRVEGLPDIVKTKLYGSMHVKHFSKAHWDTKIVSLPTHGVYKSDDIMLDWLKEDLAKDDGTRLFIADISETDFLGHAYGSESGQYLEALKRADKRIEAFFQWMNERRLLEHAAVIICSDHGIAKIDHSYLLFDAEKYVPFIITGTGIRKNNPLEYKASIMDMAPTISYLLGVRYPARSRGRVFIEAIAR